MANLLIKGIYSFILLYAFSELGERVRVSFEEIDNAIYAMKWESFPIKIQRMLPIIQMVAQQGVQLTAFGNIACSRETFKKVIQLER